MRPSRAAILLVTLCLLPAETVLAAETDASPPLHHARRKPAGRNATTGPASDPKPSVTPMFEGSDHTETAAERAASLERRRKAFFAAPAADPAASSSAAQSGVSLGGSNGLTPSMGLKF